MMEDRRIPNQEESRTAKIKTNMNVYAYQMLLPTPDCSDRRSQKSRQWGLSNFAKASLLPTPRANKVNGCNLNSPKLANRNPGNLEETIAKSISNGQAGQASQLNPQFVAEMMGFPTDWTELPFLNGEPNP